MPRNELYNHVPPALIREEISNRKKGVLPFHEHREMQLRYSGTVAFMNNDLYYFHEFDYDQENKTPFAMCSLLHSPDKIKHKKVRWAELRPFLPLQGLYNIGQDERPTVAYLIRVPARQNRYSYNKSIYQWEFPTRKIIPVAANFTTCMKYLQDCIPYPAYNTALNSVRSLDAVAVAFSTNYYVSISRFTKPVVGYKTFSAVGIIDDDGTVLLTKRAHYLYEDLSKHAPCKRV